MVVAPPVLQPDGPGMKKAPPARTTRRGATLAGFPRPIASREKTIRSFSNLPAPGSRRSCLRRGGCFARKYFTALGSRVPLKGRSPRIAPFPPHFTSHGRFFARFFDHRTNVSGICCVEKRPPFQEIGHHGRGGPPKIIHGRSPACFPLLSGTFMLDDRGYDVVFFGGAS